MTVVANVGRLFTAGAAGVLEDAALGMEDGLITWIGRSGDAPGGPHRIDAGGGLVTPGLIDCHTHPVYAGERFAEIAARSEGLSYSELGQEGGIGATVAATREASDEDLRSVVVERLRRWPQGGATTVEAKTGYRLERAGELGSVRLLASLQEEPALPEIFVTFLGAHALPSEFRGRADGYVEECASWSQDAAVSGARAVDVFCDAGYFTPQQSRVVLEAGAAAGLQPRIHADELELSGGSALAAKLGCASADHLLEIGPREAALLARAGVVATLCPGTALSMGKTPDVDSLREAGATIALGTDHNPGTSGLTSMATVVFLAVAAFGMSVTEALTAATTGGAASLRLPDRGVLEVGKRADLVVWDTPHEGAFAWSPQVAPRVTLSGGDAIWRAA